MRVGCDLVRRRQDQSTTDSCRFHSKACHTLDTALHLAGRRKLGTRHCHNNLVGPRRVVGLGSVTCRVLESVTCRVLESVTCRVPGSVTDDFALGDLDSGPDLCYMAGKFGHRLHNTLANLEIDKCCSTDVWHNPPATCFRNHQYKNISVNSVVNKSFQKIQSVVSQMQKNGMPNLLRTGAKNNSSGSVWSHVLSNVSDTSHWPYNVLHVPNNACFGACETATHKHAQQDQRIRHFDESWASRCYVQRQF